MKRLTSRDNPFYKNLKALSGSTQQQRKQGVMLLEGVHLAQAFLAAGRLPDRCVLSESALALAEVQALLAQLETARVTVLPDALYQGLSTLATGAGLLLLAPLPVPAWPVRIAGDCVVLDGVQDAGNVGSILRSAAAANIRAVFCVSGTAFAWSPKVVRAGMGAHFMLDIVEGLEAADILAQLAVPVAITDSHGASAVFDTPLAGPLAWVFGNEGAGVSAPWRAAAAHRVTIPQPGGMESLNVAAAAAVCLFEQVRQRRA
jgi:TrmH family RNA methyltransferase